MDAFTLNPAFRTYALCSAILALKMLFSAVYTGSRRQKNQGYVNPEDARVFGKEAAAANRDEAPAVAHALRIQRNDIENIPAFFAIALIYVLLGATPRGAAAYCWTFTIARILHTALYTYNLQPWRAVSYVVGALCMLGMIVQIILATL
jgi:glutathione S-transferase